ncbi:hypothetical protein OG799_18590 [Micromonospora sp. NBC_00898]|uniref:hypothetical protein n=1 Tax=Micromonospora sp. NBC_00898 TaxID=2975981 RepID=UPI00386C590E|nr:hypothetical protein OG799_18590 [Micromonospora sp. NBC_00898]
MTADTSTARRTVVLEYPGGRVVVMDSISFATDEDAGNIIVTGSHCGASAGEYARGVGVACVVGNDAGLGKNNAGIAGLQEVDAVGILGVAVGHTSARIGDGMDVWETGVITFVNETARCAGLSVGGLVRDQLRDYLARANTRGRGSAMLRTVVYEAGGRKVVVMDSMSLVRPEDRDQVVVAASNGGMASGDAARAHGCACVVLNDAGFGKEDAGVAGLKAIDADGIPGVGVGHLSAEISDGLDTWENGVISYVNRAAERVGFVVGDRVEGAVVAYLGRR